MTTMQHQIVLISGKQASGKTTLATELARQIKSRQGNYVQDEYFAKPLYDLHNFCVGYLADMGFPSPYKKDGNLLQYLGTEWGRKTYGDQVWVQSLKNRISKEVDMRKNHAKKLVTIISDCRFENEFDAFPEALRIRLEAPESARKERSIMFRENTNHASETGLDIYCNSGVFDMYFYTAVQGCTPEHIASLIIAQLDKNTWAEKRGFLTDFDLLPVSPVQNIGGPKC